MTVQAFMPDSKKKLEQECDILADSNFERRRVALLLQDKLGACVAFPGQRTTAEVTHYIPPGFEVITIRLRNTLVRIYAGISIRDTDRIPLRIRDMRLLHHILLRIPQIYNTNLSAEFLPAP